MSVLVLVEHTEGTIKKKNFEAVQYAAEIAKQTGTTRPCLRQSVNYSCTKRRQQSNYNTA